MPMLFPPMRRLLPSLMVGDVDNRTFWTETKNVRAAEFVRRVKRVGNARGIEVRFVAKRGKGSHGTLYYGSARTIVKDLKKELPTGTLHAMLEQLGLTLGDLR